VDKKTQLYNVMDSNVPCLREIDNSVLIGGQQCLYPDAAVCWHVSRYYRWRQMDGSPVVGVDCGSRDDINALAARNEKIFG
jgi:hypothetical protein